MRIVTGNAGKTGFYKCESVDFHIYKMWFSFYLKLENIEIIFDIYFPLQWREDYENR